jgi:hypothetical protein
MEKIAPDDDFQEAAMSIFCKKGGDGSLIFQALFIMLLEHTH